MIRYGSYRVFQRYLCKDCDRTFNDQTGTVFEHSEVALRKWFLVVYTYIRFNTSLRQLDVEISLPSFRDGTGLQRFRLPATPIAPPSADTDSIYVS